MQESEKKFYSFDTYNARLYEKLREFLKKSGIYYELSEMYDGWHYEIKCNDQEKEVVQNYIDQFFAREFAPDSCIA